MTDLRIKHIYQKMLEDVNNECEWVKLLTFDIVGQLFKLSITHENENIRSFCDAILEEYRNFLEQDF